MSAGAGFAGHAGLRLRDGAGELPHGTGGLAHGTGDMAHGTGGLAAGGLAHGTGVRVHVWLHAAAAAGHDFHAGAGDFAAVLAAIDRARGRTVAVSSLLTRSNARVLVLLPALLRGRGVAAWRIAVPRIVGAPVRAPGGVQVAGVGALDGLVPRLSVAIPHALQALARARQLGLAAGIVGAPLCLLGPFAGLSLPGAGVFAAVCEGCPARARCPGVDAGYLERFAGDELSPRGLRAPVGVAPAAELFHGTGVLEQAGGDMSQGAGAGRRHLPVVVEGGRGG
ncbi:hypothetical protein [Nannocystis sp.]|uniref:hypothetical protein n=1 Tax=Nannocystis sp. TaxID=1962667 RepID=UPI0025CBE042|nr:hypothetical protein [Nannocystis sp.]MBK7824308.1 hypothetical protein [Nannocystis sp.]